MQNNNNNLEEDDNDVEDVKDDLNTFLTSGGPHFFTRKFVRTNAKQARGFHFVVRKRKGGSEAQGVVEPIEEEKKEEEEEEEDDDGTFLDVELTITMLERSERWRALVTESVAFVILILFFVGFILGERFFPELNQSAFEVVQELVDFEIPVWVNTVETNPAEWLAEQKRDMLELLAVNSSYLDLPCSSSVFLAPCSWTVCPRSPPMSCGDAPPPLGSTTNGRILASRTSSPTQPKTTLRPSMSPTMYEQQLCSKTRIVSSFRSLSSLSEFNSWMDYVVYKSSLFSQSGNRATFRDTNLVLGAVRIRQVRTQPVLCSTIVSGLGTSFQYFPYKNDMCVGYYYIGNEDQSTLQLKSSTYKYYNASELYEMVYLDKTTNTIKTLNYGPPATVYPGESVISGYGYSGYVVDIPAGDRCQAVQIWNRLKDENFISPQNGTSAVFVTFTLLNPSINGYAFVSLLTEFLPGEIVKTTIDIRTFRIQLLAAQPYSSYQIAQMTTNNGFGIGTLVISGLFLIFYLVRLFLDMQYLNKSSEYLNLMDRWRILDFLQLSLIQASVWQLLSIEWQFQSLFENAYIFDQANLVSSTPQSISDFNNGDYLSLFDTISYSLAQNMVLVGTGIILSALKFFKYLDLYSRFSVVWRTIKEVDTYLFGWTILYVCLLFVFSFSAYFMYGSISYAFNSVGAAVYSTFLFTLGGFLEEYLISAPSSPLANLVYPPSVRSYLDPGNIPSLLIPNHVVQFLLAQPQLWIICFIIVFHWVVMNVLFGIIILGYRSVFKSVLAEEAEMAHLAHLEAAAQANKEKKRLQERVNSNTKDFPIWRRFRQLLAIQDYHKIVLRLKTDNDLLTKGFISRSELRSVVSEIIPSKNSNWAKEIADSLMTLYSVKLDRIDDSVLVYEKLRRLVAYPEAPWRGKTKPPELKSVLKPQRFNHPESGLESELLLDGASSEPENQDEDDDNDFDPEAEEKWLRSLFAGDALLSMAFVQNVQAMQQAKRHNELMQALDAEECAIEANLKKLQKALATTPTSQEQSVSMLSTSDLHYGYLVKNNGVVRDPNNNGIFYVHHTSSTGEYRFIGQFRSYREAEAAYAKIVVFMEDEEAESGLPKKSGISFFSRRSQATPNAGENANVCSSTCQLFCEGLISCLGAVFQSTFGGEQYAREMISVLSADGVWYDSRGNPIDDFVKPREVVPPRGLQ